MLANGGQGCTSWRTCTLMPAHVRRRKRSAAVFGVRRLVIATVRLPGGGRGRPSWMSQPALTSGPTRVTPTRVTPPCRINKHTRVTHAHARAAAGRCLQGPIRREDKSTPRVCPHILQHNQRERSGGAGAVFTPRESPPPRGPNASSDQSSRGCFDFSTS